MGVRMGRDFCDVDGGVADEEKEMQRYTCVLCPSSGGSLGAEHLEAQGRITKITHH